MIEFIIFILSFLVLIVVFVEGVFGWSNLTPSSSSFYTSNMVPDYEDPGTAQYFSKLVENTGYNFYQCTNILPHKRIYISAQTFTSLQELTFDAEHNWAAENISIIVQPSSSSYWSSVQYSSRIARCLTLSGSYLELYKHEDTGVPDYDFDIKQGSGGGFTIKNNITSARILTVMITQGSLHVGA